MLWPVHFPSVVSCRRHREGVRVRSVCQCDLADSGDASRGRRGVLPLRGGRFPQYRHDALYRGYTSILTFLLRKKERKDNVCGIVS